MPRPIYAAALLMILAGLACTSGTGGTGCSQSNNRASCYANQTAVVTRNVLWDEYCTTVDGCSDATEGGLSINLRENSSAKYPEYAAGELWCTDVTFTMDDGSTEIHYFVIDYTENKQGFEVAGEAQVESCFDLDN